MLSSRSSGSMKGANTSSISAPLSASAALSAGSTQEFTTTGRNPYSSPAWRISPAAARAFSSVSTNGMRSVTKRTFANWVSRLWPMVSAVMPVPSET